jgi:phage/plasmid-like protein (TIGR03299 family)
MQTATETLKKNGCDFDIETRPVFIPTDIPNKFIEPGDYRAIVRPDTGTVLGFASDLYQPIPPSLAFGWLDDLTGTIEFEKAVAMRGGKAVAVTARFPSEMVVRNNGGTDTIIPKFMFYTRNDASGALRMAMQLWRLACENGLTVPLGGPEFSFKLSHVGKDIDERLEMAHEAIGIAGARFGALVNLFGDLWRRKITDDQMFDYFQASIGVDPRKIDKKTASRKIAIWTDLNERVGVEVDRIGKNLYTGYQAVTGNIDHGRSYRDDSTRFESINIGAAAREKSGALCLAGAVIAADDPTILTRAAVDPRYLGNCLRTGREFIFDRMRNSSAN